MPFEKGNKAAKGRRTGTTPRSLSCRELRQQAEANSAEMLTVLVSIALGQVADAKVSDMRAAANDVLEWAHGKRGTHIVSHLPADWDKMTPQEQVHWAEATVAAVSKAREEALMRLQ